MPSQRCQCGVTYQFPSSAIGKRAKCKKCGLIFLLEPDETSSIPLDGSLDWDEPAAPPATTPIAQPQLAAEAADADSFPRLGKSLPSQGYSKSILWTLLFPMESRNLITFVILWVVLWLAHCLASIPIVGLLTMTANLLVATWYATFRFMVVQSAAAGEEEIPDFGFSGDWWGELFVPFCAWIGSWIVVIAPSVVWLVICAARGTIEADDLAPSTITSIGGFLNSISAHAAGNRDLCVLIALIVAGLFSWPIVVLCVALGGFGTVLRVDLMALTVMRTLPVYWLTVLAVGLATAGKMFIAHLVRNAGAGGAGFGGMIGSALFNSILTTGATLYLDIVAMRMIGLYYHHFKHRFAWEWG